MAFLAVDSRRVICSPATLTTDVDWDVEQDEAMLRKAEVIYLKIRGIATSRLSLMLRARNLFKTFEVKQADVAPRVVDDFFAFKFGQDLGHDRTGSHDKLGQFLLS